MARTKKWSFPPNSLRMQRCIYCLQETTVGNVLPFNTEHVVPHHATRGVPDNLLLTNLVCQPCNTFFGRTLDNLLQKRFLATAAHLLYKFPKDNAQPIFESVSARFPIVCKKYRALNGAVGTIAMLNGKPSATLHPQIAVELEDGRWIHVHKKRPFKVAQLTVKPSGLAFSMSETPELNSAKKKLRAQWIVLLSLEEMICSKERRNIIHASLERTIHRAVAKIAFNYLAWALAKRPDILYSDAFDDIRNFVLFQSGPANLVTTINTLTPSQKFIDKHRLCLRAIDDDTGRGLEAYVNLFGVMKWRVTLSTSIQCFKRLGIRNEHIWDVPARQCLPIPHRNEFRTDCREESLKNKQAASAYVTATATS